MIVQEPNSLEVLTTVWIGNLFGGMFKEYIDRLDLKGDERVLELGPSAGNSTRYLAERLLKGGGCLTTVDISAVWVEVARKRLRKFPNVEVKLGDITSLDIPNHSQDVIFMSFVLHEIPYEDRPLVVRHLVDKLVPGGKVYIREPLLHISKQSIQNVMKGNGLIEISSAEVEVKTQGQAYEGVYRKPAEV